MKRLIAILLFLGAAQFSWAQHYVGVRGGYGGGGVRLYPPVETKQVWGLYNAGVSWKYYSSEKVLGGIAADLEWMQYAYDRPLTERPDTSYFRYVNSVTLPLMWQPHIYVIRRNVRAFINLGVTFSYNFNSSYAYISKTNGTLEEGPYDMLLVRDNRWGYGLVGGFGLDCLLGRWEIFAEGRYYFGYSDILRNRNKYPANPLRSPLDAITVSVGVFYRLGQGGLLSAPSRRAQRRIDATAAAAAALEAEAARKEAADRAKAAEAAAATEVAPEPVPVIESVPEPQE